MNQILCTQLEQKEISSPVKIKKNFFKFQFVFSIFSIIILIVSIVYYYYSLKSKEKLSSKIIDNYNISKLYVNNTNSVAIEENVIFCIIEIPKINIYYPVFSSLTDELLKISPCKFYGTSLTEDGNICIAGHNYNNSAFFSNLPLLRENDEIYLYDNYNQKYCYYVTSFYEVEDTDLRPVFDYDKNTKILTLITCNNFNSNRFIIRALSNAV